MALLLTSDSGSEIPFDQGQLLAALALGVMQHLGGDAAVLDESNNLRTYRMVRCGPFALLEKPTDATSPQCIDCYLVEEERFAAVENGIRFKLDPACVLFSLQRLHNAKPPDFHLRAVSDPQGWFGAVASTLLGELQQRAPHLFEGLDLPPLRDPSALN